MAGGTPGAKARVSEPKEVAFNFRKAQISCNYLVMSSMNLVISF